MNRIKLKICKAIQKDTEDGLMNDHLLDKSWKMLKECDLKREYLIRKFTKSFGKKLWQFVP